MAGPHPFGQPTTETGQRRSDIGHRTSPVRVSLVVTMSVLAVTACGTLDARIAVVRDSAGVRIVEHPERAVAAAWRLGAEPVLDLGVLDGAEEMQFYQVSDAVRLRDGTLVVANAGTHELRFYDAEGRFLRRAGRQGDGPGEFQAPGTIALFAAGDSIGVYDWRLRRVTVYDLAGVFQRSFPLQFPQGSPSPTGAFDDGTWLATASMVFRPGDVSEVRRDTTAYFVFAPDGSLADSLFETPSWEFYVQGDRQFVMAQSLPFGRGTAAAVLPDAFWAGVTDRYELVRYAPDGTPQLIVRMAHTHLPVTPEDVDAVKRERLEGYDDLNLRRRTERMLAEMPIPETMPAFRSLAVDDAGNLWVADFMRPGAAETTWTVFGPDGALLARAATPEGFRVMDIGSDFVLGTWTDDLEVEHVRMYDLIRGPAE